MWLNKFVNKLLSKTVDLYERVDEWSAILWPAPLIVARVSPRSVLIPVEAFTIYNRLAHLPEIHPFF